MIVVSDTSPLRALSAIGRLDLIPAIFGEAFLPPAVMQELLVPVKHLPVFVADDFPFLVMRRPLDVQRVSELHLRLNSGEAEAISLALELRADAILIDERLGRREAEKLGLRAIGVLGILADAKHRGLVVSLTPLIAELRAKIGFRISAELLEMVLRDAGEFGGLK